MTLQESVYQALIAAERSAPGPPLGAQTRVWAKLQAQASVGAGASRASEVQAASAPPAAGGQVALSALAGGSAVAGLVAGLILLLASQPQAPGWRAPSPASPPMTASRPVSPADHVAAVVVAPAARAARPVAVATTEPATEAIGPGTRVRPGQVVPKRAGVKRVPAPVSRLVVAPRKRVVALKAPPAVEVSVAVGPAPTVKPASAKPALRPITKEPAARKADPEAERKLLDAARSALSSGSASTALKRVREHRRRFSRGALSQEREALWVRALVKAGRFQQAQRRGAGFMKRFPRSLHTRAVKAALKKAQRARAAKTPD